MPVSKEKHGRSLKDPGRMNFKITTRFVSRSRSQLGGSSQPEISTNSLFFQKYPQMTSNYRMAIPIKILGKTLYLISFFTTTREIEFGACENPPKHVFNLLHQYHMFPTNENPHDAQFSSVDRKLNPSGFIRYQYYPFRCEICGTLESRAG